ncbi:MAG TPA: hypothetical protein DET40_18440 [Lentisphaeria bacterium]|nr:MAG: hypothetical protein A2X45_14580 [Lentisphaerae bacterium GWF2_50_93]HCE45523.1 hypothetical protein [Lentisphaeria bacterium]
MTVEISKLKLVLDNLRLADLKHLVDKYELIDVRISLAKEPLIDEICKSPTLRDDNIAYKLYRAGEYFYAGGQNTLSLFRVNERLPFNNIEELKGILGSQGTIYTFDGAKFRYKDAIEITFQEQAYYIATFEYPGREREIFDFKKGIMKYRPTSEAICFFRTKNGRAILDIRCPSAESSHFSKCISMLVWGKGKDGHLNHTPARVSLTPTITETLRDKFNAKSFLIKISEADEIDTNGKLHPSTTEYLSKTHDLTIQRESGGLEIATSADDLAHGLVFDDKYDDIVLHDGCKITLNYPKGQICFRNSTTLGAYDKVINTILG